jgi:hypothetical protein
MMLSAWNGQLIQLSKVCVSFQLASPRTCHRLLVPAACPSLVYQPRAASSPAVLTSFSTR